MNFELEISDERSKLYESIIEQKKSLLNRMDEQDDILLTLKSNMEETISKNNFLVNTNADPNEHTPENSFKHGQQVLNSDHYSILNTLTRKASAHSSTNEDFIDNLPGERLYHQALNSYHHKNEVRDNLAEK